jgi:hypothetical protein
MQLDKTALIATLEEAYDEDLQASVLKSQAKVIMDKRKERLEDFAKDAEVDKKLINKAYARYKELRKGSIDVADEDFYTIMALVDEGFAEDADAEDKD